MSIKDRTNKVSGALSLGFLLVILAGYVTGNDSLLGFPSAMMLYGLMPLALIWFGTRKNGCGSCNQACAVPEQNKMTD